MTTLITAIDAALLADSCDTPEFREAFDASDETTRRAVVGYLNVYAGPWGLKASEEDAVLGIIAALWPEWADFSTSEGIEKFREDARLGELADDLCDDCGETPVFNLVREAVIRLRRILGDPEGA